MDSPMKLDIWKGDWGLPSADLESLRVMALCKFSGAQFEVNSKTHTWSTPNGKLPVFRHYKHTHCSFEGVLQYLATKNVSPDFGLSEKQKADAVAFTVYLKDHLYPAFLHTWWMDDRNYIELTRKWYARTMPFPLNFYYPGQYHELAERAVKALFPYVEDERMLETELYERAEHCINAISARLGSQEFIFGNHPTSIDATLFAYLALLVMVPLPNSKLKNLVNCRNNLVQYVKRISQRYFPADAQVYAAQKAKESGGAGNTDVENIPNKRRNLLLAVSFAVVANAFYAYATGLVKIPPGWFGRVAEPPKSIRIPISV